jgi:NitT/TauT family transport system permease protein
MSSADMTAPTTPGFSLSRFKPPYALITLFALLVIWEVGARMADVPTYLLPTPSAIILAFRDFGPLLIQHAGVTLLEIVLGFAIAVLVGIPLATSIAYSKVVDRSIYPLIVGSQTVPKAAIAPLLLAAFGYGIAPKIIIVALMSFFPVVINSVVGFRAAPPEMLHLASSMGANGWQTFWRFRLPQALPSMFAGMKLASVLAVIGAVVAEFVGARSGLGYVIMVAGSNFRMDQQFAAIIVLSAMGMVFFWIIGMIEARVLPKHGSTNAGDH